MGKKWHLIIMIIILSLLAACSSVEIGESQSEKTSITLQEEKGLHVSIRIGAGDLTVSGEPTKAAEVDFTYNVEKLKPMVEYEILEQTGQLSIYQSNMNVPLGNIKELEYKGNVSLNNTLPLTLYVKTGAGQNMLDLTTFKLQSAEIYSGVGETTINMNGNYQESFTTTIESGVGTTNIILPKKIGVKVFVESGIGQVETEGLIAEDKKIYVNEAYEKAKVKIDMKIKMGVGDVLIKEGE